MSFEIQVQQWVALDNQLQTINEKAKAIRSEKNQMEENILQYATKHNLTNSLINISDGRLKFLNTKQTPPLTLKYIEDCLSKCIKNPDHVKSVMTYIKDNRDSKYSQDLKRYYTK